MPQIATVAKTQHDPVQLTFASAPASGSWMRSHAYCWAEDHCQHQFPVPWPRQNRWLLPQQALGYRLTGQRIHLLPRTSLLFDTFLWFVLSCHSVVRQSRHGGGEEQRQAEPLDRAACRGDGSYLVQKTWLLKRNKGQHVRAATIVLGLPRVPDGSQPAVQMSRWSSNVEQSVRCLWPPRRDCDWPPQIRLSGKPPNIKPNTTGNAE